MTTLLLRACFVVLVTTVPFTVGAQDDAFPVIDPSIETVITRGYWTAGEASGSFRVLEIAEGWESIRRRVIVQWLEQDQEAQATVVRAAVDLSTILTSAYSISEPVITKQGTAWHLTVRTSDQPLTQPTNRAVFALGTPGTVRRVRAR